MGNKKDERRNEQNREQSIEKINEVNNIGKDLARLIRKTDTSYQYQDITTDSAAVKNIISVYYEYLYVSKFNNLEKWKNSLKGENH